MIMSMRIKCLILVTYLYDVIWIKIVKLTISHTYYTYIKKSTAFSFPQFCLIFLQSQKTVKCKERADINYIFVLLYVKHIIIYLQSIIQLRFFNGFRYCYFFSICFSYEIIRLTVTSSVTVKQTFKFSIVNISLSR